MTNKECVLLNEKDVASRLKLSPKTLRNKRSDPTFIPFIKIGSAVRYRLSDVEAFIALCCRTSTSDNGGR